MAQLVPEPLSEAQRGPELASTSGRQLSYQQYEGEHQIGLVMELIDNELSEPYSIFTYRYFLHNWPSLCFLAFDRQHCLGTVICKLDDHNGMLRGYIAMLVVQQAYRGCGAGTQLVHRAIERMVAAEADEVVLEAEVTNSGALALYSNLGFVRDKRLARYYMNGEDAFRLKLLLPLSPQRMAAQNHACACGHDHSGHDHAHHGHLHDHPHGHHDDALADIHGGKGGVHHDTSLADLQRQGSGLAVQPQSPGQPIPLNLG